jgi:hypothetical protein
VYVQKGSILRVTRVGFGARPQNCEKQLLVSSLSLRPSVMEQSAFSGRIFIEFDFLGFIFRTVEEIQVSLSSHKNDGHFT